MDRFPIDLYPPGFGAGMDCDERVLVAPFGDGYEQRAPDGINTEVNTYKVTWNKVPEEIGAPVYQFLKSRLKKVPFLFRIPAPIGGEERQVICEKLSITYPENMFSITAELVQKHNLGGFQ